MAFLNHDLKLHSAHIIKDMVDEETGTGIGLAPTALHSSQTKRGEK